MSVDPTNATGWGTRIRVGDNDRDVTKLHLLGDLVLVGKEDGLFYYQRVWPGTATAAESFIDAAPELNLLPSSENFDRGIARAGWLYLAASEITFLRYTTPNAWQDMSYLIAAPAFTEFGGRIRAFAQDGHNLYLVMETPVASTSTTKVHYLIAMVEETIGGALIWRAHTLSRFTMADVYYAIKNGSYLYIFGRAYNSDAADYTAALYRFVIPTKSQAPYKDPTPNLVTSGTIITPWIDWNSPAVEKGFTKLDILSKKMTANLTATVYYQLDNAADSNADADWTELGGAGNGVFNTSPSQT